MKSISIQTLAKLLAEELHRDHWGDIDPGLFGIVSDVELGEISESELEGFDNVEDVNGLRNVLKRVVTRLNEANEPFEAT